MHPRIWLQLTSGHTEAAVPSPVTLRLRVQFEVCCGAFRVESCRESTQFAVWPWLVLSLPWLIFAQKRKGAASVRVKARVCSQDIHWSSPYVPGRESLPLSCGASTSATYAAWNSYCKAMGCARDVHSCFSNLQASLSHCYSFGHTPWRLTACLWWLLAMNSEDRELL